MAERYTSLVALVLDRAVDDVGVVVSAAREAGGVDRASAVGDGRDAQQVLWGGRMQRGVVRRTQGADGAPLLRLETYVGAEGVTQGMRRQAALLDALAGVVGRDVVAVRDLSAAAERDRAWLDRVAAGEVRLDDAITAHAVGEDALWVHTHGAARFDVPDLELYGVPPGAEEQTVRDLREVHRQLLRGGMRTELVLPDGTPVYLVPVTRAWQRLTPGWPGVGEGRDGHDGPRATLSVLHKRRFGRYPLDLDGVVDRLR